MTQVEDHEIDDTDYDYLQESPIGREVLDKVLLAIIDAHPLDKKRGNETAANKARENRLRKVKRELFGTIGKVGNTSINDDAALQSMALYYINKANLEFRKLASDEKARKQPKSYNEFLENSGIEITPIARKIASTFFPGDSNAVDRLDKKFRSNLPSLLLDLDNDNITDVVHFHHAIQICDILERSGVKLVRPRDRWR